MKLTKLLAMLLALCMIICCFAACGGSDDEDEDEDEKVEEKEKDEDEDEDEDKSSKKPAKDDAELQGTWKTTVDLSGLLAGDLEAEYPEIMFGITVEFDDEGSYVITAVDIPDVDDFVELYMAVYSESDITEEDAEVEADVMISMINEDPRMGYGDYEVDGNVVELINAGCKLTFDISGDEMTIEEIDCEYYEEYAYLDGAKFEKQ